MAEILISVFLFLMLLGVFWLLVIDRYSKSRKVCYSYNLSMYLMYLTIIYNIMQS